MPMKPLIPLALAVSAAALALPAHAGKTLDAVKARGQVVCGVNTSGPGFSNADSQGRWTGLDVDVCRAIAAAVFNDATKIKFVPLSAKDRFTALQSGEIDVLSRNTTWSLSRDTSLGANFTGVTYYDVPQTYGMTPYRYTVVNGQTVLVEPRSRRIVQVVD